VYQRAIKNLGGVILFPYPLDENKFKGTKYDQSLSTVNIGAVPLKPGSDNVLFQTFLDRLFDSPGDELMENVIEYDKEPLRLFERNVRIPVLIGLIRSDSNQARLDFFEKYNLFYVHKSTNSRLFDIKRILIYNQKSKSLIGQYKVEKIFFDKKESYPLIKPTKKEYIFYKVKLEKEINIDFNLEGLGNNYFFTNQFAVDIFEKTQDKSFLKLNTENQFRTVRKLRAQQSKFEISRIGDFTIDESNRDISNVKIKLDVVCGLIKDEKGQFFIARKKEGKSNAGKWEFPGGKVLNNESNENAIKRELQEEIGMEVKVIKRCGETVYDINDFCTINLIAYECEFISATYRLVDHDDKAWIEKQDLPLYRLNDADCDFIKFL
jgi:8-oxo-dGTP diphosphatase